MLSFEYICVDESKEQFELDWNAILVDKHFNENFHVEREPLLEETETLLRDFYKPYNDALVRLLDGQATFAWEDQSLTLREQQLREADDKKKKKEVKALLKFIIATSLKVFICLLNVDGSFRFSHGPKTQSAPFECRLGK